MLDQSTKELIRKYAVKNAHDYGKAITGPIISKMMSLPNMNIKEARREAEAIVKWVNSLSKSDLESHYAGYSAEFQKEEKEKTERSSKPKMELPEASIGAFHTRFAPEPGGYLHVGHAKAAFLARSFADLYKGKISLYFDDSNPEKEKQEFVDEIKKDLDWLGISFDREYYASDSLEKIYVCARQLLSEGKAYGCTCSSEIMKEKRLKGEECEHRHDKKGSVQLFESMLKGDLDEGDAVIRFKGEMKSDNTALRDPTLLRIKKDLHYRQGNKYHLWPVYDFNTPINDSLNGITDVIRSKEYELRDTLYYMLLDALKMRKPRIHSDARLTIKNNITSKRETNLYIKEGALTGYDDPRLVTLAALRRRGVKPAAIKEFVLRFGMSRSESVVDVSMLLDENKKIIDPGSKRLYYVEDPIKLTVEEAQPRRIELKFHPSNNLGSREYQIDDTFYISATDAAKLSTKSNLGLKGLCNLIVKKKTKNEILASISTNEPDLRVQWVAEGKLAVANVLMPNPPLKNDGNFDAESMKISKGYVESHASKLNEGEIVQFERFGFCILDKKKEMSFIFISK